MFRVIRTGPLIVCQLGPVTREAVSISVSRRFFSLHIRLVCNVLVNNDNFTVNYGVKQSKFIKPTSEPRASDPEESNEPFDRAIRE